jgi:beta-phosphoglucomutase family hydrolase
MAHRIACPKLGVNRRAEVSSVNAAGYDSKVKHWTTAESLGLPPGIRACLFDMDGVLTQTAQLHAAAWKETFDPFLRELSAHRHERFVPFDAALDYDRYVDGRARYDGVREFLAARRIEGDAATVTMLGKRKNDLVLALISRRGLRPYEGSARYVRAAAAAGLRRAVVSASANCCTALEAAGLTDLFEVRIDAARAAEEHLEGKPAPDTFLAAARALDVDPAEAAVFEDALAGVAAGRAGHFGFVVGVDRTGHAERLRRAGADRVVSDLGELLESR